MRKLLSIDLSLSCTGYCLRDIDTHKLLSYGDISPSMRGLKGIGYPEQQVIRTRQVVTEILKLIDDEVEVISVEEVNRGIARLSHKILCMVHGVLLDHMSEKDLKKVIYISSDGSDGWRSRNGLKLQLSEADKIQNKQVRKLNRKIKKGKKLPLMDVKQMAVNYVNKKFDLNLTVNENDKSDAIAQSDHVLLNVLGKTKCK